MDGTAVIATSPDGHVQGCEVDFDQSKPAGFDLSDAQAERARIALSGRIIRAHCSPHIAKALTSDTYMARKVMDKLRDAGWRFEVRPVSTGNNKEQIRCAECDCVHGGVDCNWIKQPDDTEEAGDAQP